MQLEIQARDFQLTEALRAYIERRLSFALSSRYEQIQRIVVRLSDINGTRGGIDKRCQIQVKLPRLRDIVIEDTESDLYVAIDRATDRVSRTVARRLARLFSNHRKLFVPHRDAAVATAQRGEASY
jgi:ribosomal subunit interface protein